jgi:predicted transcriptional regulator
MATAKKKTAPKKQATKKPVPKPAEKPAQEAAQKEATTSKKAQIHALLERPEGATIEEMAKLTNWQNHTVRGFLSMLKKAGKTVTSERVDNARRYFIKTGA